jgi:tRNA threonylcarbamoyladenosine biosynthesis protein TsaB
MILSIDSFSDILGITLIKDNRLFVRESFYKLKPYSELIVERLDKIFCQFQLDKKSLNAVVVNKGPGSLTSLRVGVTVAKTIAYSLNIPIYGYISLDVMAYRYRYFRGKIISVVNAGKGEIFYREYISDGNDIYPETDIQLKKLSSLLDEKQGILIVTKNVKTELEHVELLDDLSVDGCFFALKKELKEDIMTFEPLYIRSL